MYAPFSRALLRFLIYNMEKGKFEYSIKIIPLPSERAYLLQLMEKTETFIARIRSILKTNQMIIQVKGMV